MADKEKKIDWDAEAEKLKKPEGLNDLIETIAASEKLTKKELLQKAKEALYGFHGFALIEKYLPSDAERTKEIIEKAIEAFEEENGITLQEAIKKEIEKQNKAKYQVISPKKIELPLDEINREVWRDVTANTDGQFKIICQNNKVNSLYNIDFSALEPNIAKKISDYDKRIYIAVSALYNAGNEAFTISQIFEAMGYTKKPGHKDREKVKDEINKMMVTKITIDNIAELTEGKNYNEFKYNAALLPCEYIDCYINGVYTESGIHLFREPPLMTFAKDRKQFTTIDLKVLQSPISKTEQNLAIDDYLIQRISRMKKGKGIASKILIKTVCENLGINSGSDADRKKRKRLPEKLMEYLNYYAEIGFIKSYSLTDEYIKIKFDEDAE